MDRPADHPGPLVFVDDLDDPHLAPEDRHHLRRVLRLRPGDTLVLADGHGGWRTAVLGDPVEVTGPVRSEAPADPLLTVGFALVKGERPELIVQKLTELGIDRIVPFRADRSVVRWDDDRSARATTRLRAVARAAAMQCRRARLPQIEAVDRLPAVAALPGVCLAERGGGAPSLARPVVLVGPEGGWSDDERGLGLPTMALGPTVLRVETAAIAAATLLTALRAGTVTESP